MLICDLPSWPVTLRLCGTSRSRHGRARWRGSVWLVLGACSELGGTVVALDDLWGRDAARTQEQLRAARSWDDRFTIAEAALARRLEAARVADPEVTFAWGQMATTQGRVRVERLAAETGWSRKRLWSRFRSQIGLIPKRAAQLVRFDHAAHRLAIHVLARHDIRTALRANVS